MVKHFNRVVRHFNKAVLQAALKTVIKRARKTYITYWPEKLQQLEKQVIIAWEHAENEPSLQNNIEFQEKTAFYKEALTQAARNSWIRKTEQLNFQMAESYEIYQE